MTTPFDFLNAVSALEKPDGVIAFPTDTVYGLGCLPSHAEAIKKIYRMKGRESQKPLILMGASLSVLMPYVGPMSTAQSDRFRQLAEHYWPGALTLVVPKSDKVLPEITQGIDTIGLRIPDTPILSVLFQMIPEGVLATTSANLSGQPECPDAAQVFETFRGQLDFIFIQDRIGSGKASTVAAVQPGGNLTILRQGSIVLD